MLRRIRCEATLTRGAPVGVALLTLVACAPSPVPGPDAAPDRVVADAADATRDTPVDAATDTAQDTSIRTDAEVPTDLGEVACRTTTDCGRGRYCDTTRMRCVECLLQDHCAEGGRVCSMGRCVASVPCTSSRMCPDQVCDTARMRCVDCVADNDCGAGLQCRSNLCTRVTSCTSSRECSGAGLVCDVAAGRCVECVADNDCAMGRRCGTTRVCIDGGSCAPGTAFCVSTSRLRVCDAGGTAREMDCGAGTTCTGGACRPPMMTCPAGQTLCGAGCVDLQRDTAHCGACGRACAAGQACAAGTCAMVDDVIPPLNVARWGFGTVARPDGRIFILGGYGLMDRSAPLNTIEVYEPSDGRWHMRSMPMPMGDVHAVGLADGRIFIANVSAANGVLLPQGRFYDPATDRWSLSRTSTQLRDVHLTLGNDGAAYMFGGADEARPGGVGDIHRYDPLSDAMTRLTTRLTPCRSARSVLARDGDIYVLGGSGTDTIEAFDVASRTVRSLPARFADSPRAGAAVMGGDGRIYYAGGWRAAAVPVPSSLVEAYAFDPVSGSLTSIAPLPESRGLFALVARPGGRITAIGGIRQMGTMLTVVSTVHTYTIATNTWR